MVAAVAIDGGIGSMRYMIAMLVTLLGSPAWAGGKVALLIGNAIYDGQPPLRNPVADTRLMAQALTTDGFDVEVVTNAGKGDMENALRRFGAKADGADVAVVYYSGHGMEIGGRNYLLPVTATLTSDRDADLAALPLDTLLTVIGGAKLRVVVLDACRNNPFLATMTRSAGTRAVGQGLARVEPAGRTLVFFAAKAGSTALDGDGANSPFATALAKRLVEPGLELGFVFRRVTDDVNLATAKAQEPFQYGSLGSDEIYLGARPAGADGPSAESLFFQGVMKTNKADGYREYLRRYPVGEYAQVATVMLGQLDNGTLAAPPTQGFRLAASTAPAGGPSLSRGLDTGAAFQHWGVSQADLSDASAPNLLRAANFAGRVAEARAAAEGGDPVAALLLGMGLANGIGVPRDAVTGLSWTRIAAEKGLARAQASVGIAYYRGEAVPADYTEAVEWFRRAAAAGSHIAEVDLGQMYADGKGVPKNRKEALRLFRQSGVPLAWSHIGALYLNGGDPEAATPTPPLEAQKLALPWFQKAAAAGYPDAMTTLVWYYRYGMGGLTAQPGVARDWERKAAAAAAR